MSDLMNVRGYAPAALVVEFNLYEMKHRYEHELEALNQLPRESDEGYHARLSKLCYRFKRNYLFHNLLDERARLWSDHYRRLSDDREQSA